MTDAALIADAATASDRLAHVAAVIRRHRYRYANELELHAAIAQALDDAGIAYEREVRLTPQDRIDFLCDDVGVEVKIKGGPSSVARQLARYARHERIGALCLVTDRSQLTRIFAGATETGDALKPFSVVPLLGGIL